MNRSQELIDKLLLTNINNEIDISDINNIRGETVYLFKSIQENPTQTKLVLEESEKPVASLVDTSDTRVASLVDTPDTRVASLVDTSDTRVASLVDTSDTRVASIEKPHDLLTNPQVSVNESSALINNSLVPIEPRSNIISIENYNLELTELKIKITCISCSRNSIYTDSINNYCWIHCQI